MKTLTMNVPALTVICVAAATKMQNLRESLAAEKRKTDYEDQSIDVFGGYEETSVSLTTVVNELNGMSFNAVMKEEMAQALAILNSVKDKIESRNALMKQKEFDTSTQIRNVLKKVRADFEAFVNVDDLILFRMNTYTLTPKKQEAVAERFASLGIVTSANPYYAGKMFAMLASERDERKTSHQIYELVEDIVNDRNVIGTIVVEEYDVTSRLVEHFAGSH